MKKLTRDEMKNVSGGFVQALPGNCASVNAYGEVNYNQTQAQAQAIGAGGHWCCASCNSASWYVNVD